MNMKKTKTVEPVEESRLSRPLRATFEHIEHYREFLFTFSKKQHSGPRALIGEVL